MNSFTLEEVKKIAISFNRVFGTSTIVSGPKTITYKLSMAAFALTLILMLVAILTPAASSAFVLASNFTAAAFECIGIYLYAGRYERQYRNYMLRRSGVLSHEGRYEPRLCLKSQETQIWSWSSLGSVQSPTLYGKEFCDGKAVRTLG